MGFNNTDKFKSINSDQKSNYINMVSAIVKDNVKVVSFKIFDTLILSGFWENSDLFHIMEKEFCDLYVGNKSFYELRKTAEIKAQKKSKTGKPEFNDIYKQLEKISGISPDSAEKLKKRELELTEYYCYPRDCGLRLYKDALEAKKKTVLITDSYLPKETIGRILENCGIKDYSAIFFRNQYQLKKSGGTIFPIIIKKLDLRQGQLAHVGGNVADDVEAPVIQGITAVYLPNCKELMIKSGRVVAYAEKKLGKKFTSPENLILRCAMHLYSEKFFDYPSNQIVSGDFCGSIDNIGFLTLGILSLSKDYIVSSEVEAFVITALSKNPNVSEICTDFSELFDSHYSDISENFDTNNSNVFLEYFVKHGEIYDRNLIQKHLDVEQMQKWNDSITKTELSSDNNTEYKFEKYSGDNELDAKLFPKGSKRRAIMEKIFSKF
ncbi:MAG: hypothetical protein E7499_03065 [Ruminococcus sp.]|nr:hypothetical protein [Ruminococcus sp.]